MGNKVASIRKDGGITQAALARKAKVSRPYISLIESGKQETISNVVMQKIADALEKNVEEIFFINDVRRTQQGAR